MRNESIKPAIRYDREIFFPELRKVSMHLQRILEAFIGCSLLKNE
jgi:hypothetical protein